MDNINGLSNAQTERLAILAEEAGEVVQIVGKILRHGFESCNPNFTLPVTNRQRLEQELGDLLFAIELCSTEGDVVAEKVVDALDDKYDRVGEHLHYNTFIKYEYPSGEEQPSTEE